MEYDVFISYSHKDYIDENKQIIPGNIVSQIKELFDANNISYWLDEQGYSGQEFTSVITQKIKASKIFLFVSSKNSNESLWTRNEIGVAIHHQKTIIPFRYDDSTYDDSVIMLIIGFEHIDYYKNPKMGFARLLSSIQGHLKDMATRKEMERQAEERRRRDEISKQERAAKLQSLRERVENLENRKNELEKEILSQDKYLTDLRNEKRIIETNIINLQEEILTLSHNYYNQLEYTTEKTTIPPSIAHTKPHYVKPNIQTKELFNKLAKCGKYIINKFKSLLVVKPIKSKRILFFIVPLLVFLSLGIVIPYGYARHCGVKSNYINRGYYLIGGLSRPYRAECIGKAYLKESYYNSKKSYYSIDVDRDLGEALKWFKRSKNQELITKCEQFIEIEQNGYFDSDIYGKCGRNRITGEIVKIDVPQYNKPDSLKRDLEYSINLLGARHNDGTLELDNATMIDIVDTLSRKYVMGHFQGNSVTIRFKQDGNVISERTIPVEAIRKPIIKIKRISDQEILAYIENPIENAYLECSYNNSFALNDYRKDDNSIRFRLDWTRESCTLQLRYRKRGYDHYTIAEKEIRIRTMRDKLEYWE